MVQLLGHRAIGLGPQRCPQGFKDSPQKQVTKTWVIEVHVGKGVTRSGLLCIKSPSLRSAH